MNQTELRGSLIAQADTAMLQMLTQINILLEAAQHYALRHPATTPTTQMKHKELRQSLHDLGSVPRMLIDEIGRWKKGEPRLLGRNGVETFLLADLFASMDSMYWFMTREGIDVSEYSIDAVSRSYYELVRCNRLL